jgi:ATP synthase protein I
MKPQHNRIRKKSRNNNPWKMLLIVNLLGIDLVVCILAGFFLGSWLQQRTGEVLWMVAGLLIGIAIGIWTVIILIQRTMEDHDG